MLSQCYCPLVCTTVRLPYYRTGVLFRISYTKDHDCATGVQHMNSRDLSRDPRLTKEQNAIRLQGLRILARMIVRAHLRSLIEQDAAGNDSASALDPDGGDIPAKEGKRGR